MATKVVYFTVGGRPEKAEFRADDTAEDVTELFRSAAEAGPHDILKVYSHQGALVAVSPHLAENTPDTRYRLEVVATLCSGASVAADLGFEIGAMESRLSDLEKRLGADGGQVPSTVQDMKVKVDQFRAKLETVEHLSWLGLFKNVSAGSSRLFRNQTNNVQKMADHNKKVYDKFISMSNVQVTDEIREYLRKPTFDNWQWDDAEMMILLRQMYLDLNLHTRFNIEMSVLHQWLYEIYKHYNHVPFHNFKHCFMVAQMMYGVIWLVDLPHILDDIDLLILLTSAICHDLDHPGYNNTYQINARTELALRYNDISPLENHHCAVAFEILQQPAANILKNLPEAEYRRVRQGLIKCILATDMAKHSEILTNFKAVIPNFDFKNKDNKDMLMMVVMKISDISNEARPLEVAEPWIDRLLQEFFNQLLMIFIKMADISNEVRPMAVSEPWVECLLQEFFKQSDLEKLEGLPVAPFMDRDQVDKFSSQVGFIQYVLLPLFEALGELFPVIQTDITARIQESLAFYSKGCEKGDEAVTKMEV